MVRLNSYLAFDNAKTAMEYYESKWGATNIKRMPVAENMAEQFGLKGVDLTTTTMHGSFSLLGNTILCSDRFTNMGKEVTFNNAMTLLLDFNIDDETDMQKMHELYKKVEAAGDCEIEMPLEKQFWGGSMARFKDPFGLTWMLHSQKYTNE